jgi:hypothetical protein
MSEDNLEVDEDEDKENEPTEEEIRDRHRLLVLLENGDQDSYLHDEEDEDLVDVEVDSRLGDTSDDEDDLVAVDDVRTDRVHVDDSDSLSAVVESGGPSGVYGHSPDQPQWPAKQHGYSSQSSDHHLPNAELPPRDQASREEDEGGGDALTPLSNQSPTASDEDIEREVVEITEEMVDRIAEENWDHVNGCFDHEGQWRAWDETSTQINTQNDEPFIILPYVQTGW